MICNEKKMTIAEESLAFHYEKKGKLQVVTTVSVNNQKDLSLAYIPGVAEPCLQIQNVLAFPISEELLM